MTTNECLNCGKPLTGQGDAPDQLERGLCDSCYCSQEREFDDEDDAVASTPDDVWEWVNRGLNKI